MTPTPRHNNRCSHRLRRIHALVGLAVLLVLGSASGCKTSAHAERGVDDGPLTSDSADEQQARYDKALDDPANQLSRPTSPANYDQMPQGGTLQRYIGSVPAGFNWVTENSADVQELMTYVHNSFARRDRQNPDKWVPQLAYKITVNDDHTVYTVHLRKGVFWQLGDIDLNTPKHAWLKKRHELTAEDAVFFFDLVQDPKVSAGAIKSYYRDLDHAEVIDRYTFKVVWKKAVQQSEEFVLGMYPMPKWLYSRTEDGRPIPADKVGARFNTHWASEHAVGTGPYVVASLDLPKQIVLERNPTYWRQPPINTIEYHVVGDDRVAYKMLQAGQLDIAPITPEIFERDILNAGPDSPFSDSQLEYRTVDRQVYYYLGWNADRVIFSDARVRRAMTHALDRDRIIAKVLRGLAHKSDGPFLPQQEANNPDVEPLDYDLDKARVLLNEAGWKDTDGDGIREKTIDGQVREFRFTLLCYNKDIVHQWAEIYQSALREVGVVMTPNYLGWVDMQHRMNAGDFDAFTGGWGLGWSIHPFQLWHSSQADIPRGSNRVGFRNERADQIIETLRTTFDHDKRIELLREFHAIVHREQPYTFFYQPKSVYAWRPRLRNVEFQKLRPVDLSLPWFIASDKDSARQADASTNQATENE